MRILALCLILSSFGRTQDSGEAVRFAEARKLYFQGSDGDKAAYSEADKQFSQLYRQHRNEPRVKIYYGSLRLLEASHTWALWKKNSLSREGILLMNEAVATAPSDLEVRFIRAATTYDLPSFFHLREQSEQDCAYLADRAERAAKTGELEPRLAAASLYFRGVFLRDARNSDAAATAWRKAIALAPQSRAARESKEALNKSGS